MGRGIPPGPTLVPTPLFLHSEPKTGHPSWQDPCYQTLIAKPGHPSWQDPRSRFGVGQIKVAPLSLAPPASHKSEHADGQRKRRTWRAKPTARPTRPPMTRAGTKTPPGTGLPKVMMVNKILMTADRSRNKRTQSRETKKGY